MAAPFPRCFCVLLFFSLCSLSISQSRNSTCHLDDLRALRGFFDEIESGWRPDDSNSSCCNWLGVTCNTSSTNSLRVTKLELYGRRLTGELSSSIGGLTELRILNLSSNFLRGPLPELLFSLQYLEVLDLSRNDLYGRIMSNISLPEIHVLDVTDNALTGEIPLGICSGGSKLRLLKMDHNFLIGALPAEIVYKTTTNSVSAGESVAANASIQTDSNGHHKRVISEKEDKIEEQQNQSVELSRGEISPPSSDSSPETLETLMKADKRLMLRAGALNGNSQDHQTSGNSSHIKMKASSVLMQLITCGSFPFKDCGATAVKDHGLSLVSKLQRAEKQSSSGIKLEEKEYFSGILIQTKRESDDELIKLKRSLSCNADSRKSRLGLEEVDKVPKSRNNHQ